MKNRIVRMQVNGFTLIELMAVVVIVAILVAVAIPNYRSYVIRASRSAAQLELMELANLQEKIFLNSSAYTSDVSGAYNGSAAGGLGRSGASTKDGNYSINSTVGAGSVTFTLTATPIAGKTQQDDGSLSVTESGRRTWRTGTW